MNLVFTGFQLQHVVKWTWHSFKFVLKWVKNDTEHNSMALSCAKRSVLEMCLKLLLKPDNDNAEGQENIPECVFVAEIEEP